jgi:NAD(P)-dependent dehydrogenase (short-subunit alcohol dehydrogenase family)
VGVDTSLGRLQELTSDKPLNAQQAIGRFNDLLLSQHHAFAGATPHELSFTGLVVVPDLQYSSGPIETLSPEIWSDTFNTKVISTIATTQAFLPSICEFKSRVLVLTPTIVSSLKPPFHGIENTVVGALENFTTTLRRELSTLGINVCLLKLGSFDFSSVGARNHIQPISAARTYAWPASARTLYAQNFINQGRIAESRGLFGETGSMAKGSSLRQLHHAVFDALTQKHPRNTWRVGRGSVAYDILGTWVPSGIVGWMLGIRRVSLEEIAGPQLEDTAVQQSSSWETVERNSV